MLLIQIVKVNLSFYLKVNVIQKHQLVNIFFKKKHIFHNLTISKYYLVTKYNQKI